MAQKKTALDVPAMAFLNRARQYHEAAEELFAAGERRASVGSQRAITDPTYFLYFHTMELAFKAYLRAYDRPIRKIHELTKLYEECRTLGLVIGLDDQFYIRNLVSLLESGNEYQGFRCVNPNSTSQSDLAWTREVVDALMQNVSDQLQSRFPDAGIPSAAVKGILTWGKPRPKDDSKPGEIVFTVGKEVPKKDDSKI